MTFAEFRLAVMALLFLRGFQRDPDYPANTYEFVGLTKFGVLRVNINKRETPELNHWLACRFDEPKAVADADILGDRLNPHSGKWNWDNGWADATEFERKIQLLALEGGNVGAARLPRRCPCCDCGATHSVGNAETRMPDRVECLNCGLQVEVEYEPYAALEKWNRRVGAK